MRRGYRSAGAIGGALLATVIALSGLSAVAHADDQEPSPAPTESASDVPLSVVIPDLSTPAPIAPVTTPVTPRGTTTPAAPPAAPAAASTCTPATGDTAPAASAQPSEDAGALTLDRETVAADEWLVATAAGYTPGEMVQVVVYSGAVVVDSYKADAAGNLTARFRVPEETRPGDHVAAATGWQSCVAATASFVVVTDATAASFPYLWWVLIVVGVLLAALAAAAVYFRQSIAGWFSGGMSAAGSTP